MKKKGIVGLIIILLIILILGILGFFVFRVYSDYTKGSVGVIDRPDDLVIEKTDNGDNSKPGSAVLNPGGDTLFIHRYELPVNTPTPTETPEPEETVAPVETPEPKETPIPTEQPEEPIETGDPVGIYEQTQLDEDIYNILLLGMDARNYEDRSRSDTIILVSYDKSTGNIKMLSFMRDSWVYIPTKYWSRINAATAIGGPGLLINTINENFNLDIQNYVQIKFDDFKTVIDILGGVEVELTQKEIDYINNKLHNEDKDYDNDIIAEPGLITLNGTQALWHCRNRSVGNSDYARTERQRTVLKALVNKARNEIKVSQLVELIYTMKDYVNTNIDLQLMIDLGISVLQQDTINMESARVPFDGAYAPANKNGASVLELDMDKTTETIYEFLYDENIEE